MKSIKILLAGSIMLATLVACNDDFMDRFPTTDISDQNFWAFGTGYGVVL